MFNTFPSATNRKYEEIKLGNCLKATKCKLKRKVLEPRSYFPVEEDKAGTYEIDSGEGCSIQLSSTTKSSGNKMTPKQAPDHCTDQTCLLVDTPRVGVSWLQEREVGGSLLGRSEAGQTFKFGKGKVTKGSVKAARDLLSREFPQVKHDFLV